MIHDLDCIYESIIRLDHKDFRSQNLALHVGRISLTGDFAERGSDIVHLEDCCSRIILHLHLWCASVVDCSTRSSNNDIKSQIGM